MISESDLPASIACKTAGVSKSAYYAWLRREPPAASVDLTLDEIRSIAREFPKYGYRRITKELHRRGMIVNHKRVYRLMRENNLQVRRKKFKPITTESNHGLPIYPNLLRGMTVTGLNQVWVADITYVHLPNCFVYLAVIIDLFSRKVIGWDLSRNIDATLTRNALEMAIRNRKKLGFTNLIHHSDRGKQYAAKEYVELLNEFGIAQSMSGKGNVYDNAYAESFMKTLKVEEVYINEYRTFEEAYESIYEFIEMVYNEKRLHSGIEYVPPNEFEEKALKSSVA